MPVTDRDTLSRTPPPKSKVSDLSDARTHQLGIIGIVEVVLFWLNCPCIYLKCMQITTLYFHISEIILNFAHNMKQHRRKGNSVAVASTEVASLKLVLNFCAL